MECWPILIQHPCFETAIEGDPCFNARLNIAFEQARIVVLSVARCWPWLVARTSAPSAETRALLSKRLRPGEDADALVTDPALAFDVAHVL